MKRTIVHLALAFVLFGFTLTACPPVKTTPTPTPTPGSPIRECVDQARVWPKRTIPVCWENGTPADAADRGLVRAAVAGTWERESRVRFTEWDACTAGAPGIHIIIADVNPASHVGILLDGKTATTVTPDGGPEQLGPAGMALNFTFAKWPVPITTTRTREWYIKVIAIHEFGHALGFKHEQARTDTPPWCTERDDSDAFPCSGMDGKWDLSSVLAYCNPNYNGSGDLSAQDISMVRRYYGDPATNTDTRDMNCICPDGFSTEACAKLPVCAHVCRAHDFRTNHQHTTPKPHQVDCPAPTPACPAGLTWCVDRCINTTSDGAHCGGCPGQQCSGAQQCNAGVCIDCLAGCDGKCNTPSPRCNGITCACGAGERCEPAGTAPGICCKTSQKRCGDKCVNLTTDEANCGACGNRCNGTCVGGECKCARCRCPDGFCGGEDSCAGTQMCARICAAHERGGHVHPPCQ